MTRSFMAVVVVGFASMALAPVGCSQTGVGDPCVPEQEYDPTFAGFDPGEVNVESKSFDCQTRLCLANHFQGRVTCPYGQTAAGGPPTGPGNTVAKDANGNPIGVNVAAAGATANVVGCVVPGTTEAITGQGGSAGATVQPQCLSRTADKAVYCSCHCANTEGNTNDGQNYCTCPEGYACTQLVSSTGQGDTGLTGAYCIKNGTGYDSTTCPSTLLGTELSAPDCDTAIAAGGNGQCGSSTGQ
jgi:hypothetical protein